MARFQGEEVAAMLDDESDWNDLDEKAKEEEKHEASEDFNADEKEDRAWMPISRNTVFIIIANNNNNDKVYKYYGELSCRSQFNETKDC